MKSFIIIAFIEFVICVVINQRSWLLWQLKCCRCYKLIMEKCLSHRRFFDQTFSEMFLECSCINHICYRLAQEETRDIGSVPYVSTYIVCTYAHILSSLQCPHLSIYFFITSYKCWICLHTGVGYDAISSKFDFQDPGLKVYVTVAILKKKTLA